MCLAVPGKIVSIDAADTLLRCGRVDFAGVVKQVNLAYVPEARDRRLRARARRFRDQHHRRGRSQAGIRVPPTDG